MQAIINDAGSREELINGHLRLIMKLASIYSNWQPHKAKDILSVALVALIEAVDSRSEVKDGNLGAWISSKVQFAIRDYLGSDHVIPIPKTSYHRHKELGLIRTPVSLDCTVDHSIVDEDTITSNRIQPEARPEVSIELRDILSQLPADGLESKIIILRMQGFNDREVAEQLGYTPMRICQLRNKMYDRFLQLWED